MPTRYNRDQIAKVIASIAPHDAELSDELMKRVGTVDFKPITKSAEALFEAQGATSAESGNANLGMLEAIVLSYGRPVLAIQDGKFQATFSDPESDVWKQRLKEARKRLEKVIPSVGRVELANHPEFDWVGTGWLVADSVIVTNRHVASAFGMRSNDEFIFRPGAGAGARMRASIDFLEEYDRNAAAEFSVDKILWIEPESGPDLAFLKISKLKSSGKTLPSPVPLSRALVEAHENVAVIGYSARDSRSLNREEVLRIFENIYDKKRLAPGQISAVTNDEIQHDCTTLGGNSGSVVVSLRSGSAVGLHYAGNYHKANYAVPATVVAQRLREVLGGEASTIHLRSHPKEDPRRIPDGDQGTNISRAVGSIGTTSENEMSVKVSIPLEVTLRFGTPNVSGQQAVSQPSRKALSSAGELERALEAAKGLASKRDDVVSVRLGYRFRGGWITDERVIVFAVNHKVPLSRLQENRVLPLPREIEGIGVDVTTASPLQLFPSQGLESPFLLEAVRRGNYNNPDGFKLERVKEKMKIIIHVSPDAGYPQLSKFLGGVGKSLTIGMYEFTADYIFKDLLKALTPGNRKLKLIIQRFKNNASGNEEILVEDIVKELRVKLGNRFEHAWASVTGAERLFASAYHIKVAVRDNKDLWLSSGNWKPSGQPNQDPIKDKDPSSQLLVSKNREWHAIIENKNLARQFEKFLLYDLKQTKDLEAVPIRVPEILVPESLLELALERRAVPATYFTPLELHREIDVQPLLTPDNYSEQVLRVVESARKRLYFQNQSLSPLENNEDRFILLLDGLKLKQRDGLDVRIIFRDTSEFGGSEALRRSLEKLKGYGFNMSQVKVQRGCHTKGILVDGAIAVLGSHNWTNEGTLYNRDASLVFYDREVAEYLERLFLFDWEYLANQQVDETRGPIKLDSGLENTLGMIRVPVTELLG